MRFSVIIPSAKATNLVHCVRALLDHEPELSPSRIIVVDDGAREVAEKQLPTGIRWVQGVKPFVFARNINLGIAAAGGDVILLNDDALLETVGGLTRLAEFGEACGMGIASAVTNCTGNMAQHPQPGSGMREEKRMVAFVCVWISRATIDALGLLDERFVEYGFEDDDYCRRARMAGLRIGIFDGCFVDHLKLPSTFRGEPGTGRSILPGRRIYEQKWGAGAD